jgi:hypothetical protein
LGIADEANEEKHGEAVLKLNYAHHEHASFVFTARFLINHHKSLEVLKMVEYLPGFENEIMTWVPRWHVLEFVRADILGEPDDQTGFAASANLPLQIEEDDDDAILTYHGQNFPSVLAVHGQRFDRIVYTSGIISWHDLVYGDQFHSTRIYDLYAEFKKNVQSRFGIATYPTGEDFRTVFVMSAIAGLDEHGRPADTAAFVRHFLHQYGNELEDDIPDKTLARKFRMATGHGDLEMFRLGEEIRGGSRIRFLAAFKRAAEHRRLFLTARGYIGLGPAAMNVNDHTCVLFGANVPYVYRNPNQKELYDQGYLGPLSGQQMREDIIGLCYDEQAPYAAELRSHNDFYLGQVKVDGRWDKT